MKQPPAFERYDMINAAWNAAIQLVDSRGDLKEAFDDASKKFLKRKACQAMPENECLEIFTDSVEIVRFVTDFRRKHFGSSQPLPIRRYELMLSLAKALDTKFPSRDPFLTMAGCRMAELYWDR